MEIRIFNDEKFVLVSNREYITGTHCSKCAVRKYSLTRGDGSGGLCGLPECNNAKGFWMNAGMRTSFR